MDMYRRCGTPQVGRVPRSREGPLLEMRISPSPTDGDVGRSKRIPHVWKFGRYLVCVQLYVHVYVVCNGLGEYFQRAVND